MTAALQIDFSFDQILKLVKQLSEEEKLKIAKELETEAINSRLSVLLNTFHTDELSMETIAEEVEIVRQQLYNSQPHEGHL